MSISSSIVDTYPSFLHALQLEKPLTVDQWLAFWAENYMQHWPTLRDMVVNDYREQGEDWRQIAREKVFPGMNGKLPAIDNAHRALRQLIRSVEDKARQAFEFQDPVIHVLYIGLGNGAGWVTKYEGSWAVLFGLEGIVDSGFDAPSQLEGLVAHELGHVIHFTWRESHGLSAGSGPWWQLYEEGFAQQFESELLSSDSWHMRYADPDDDWLAWCHENRPWLAAEFLRVAGRGESVRPFFGSWHELRGRKQTGYFLGHQVISHLLDFMSLQDIALLNRGAPLEKVIRAVLRGFVAASQ
jgi:hypothetical protein